MHSHAHLRLLLFFDEYFNLAYPTFEVFVMTFTNPDGTRFMDVSISHTIDQNIAAHSVYFFSPSSELLFKVSHNGTQVPPFNFISRSLTVEEAVRIVQTRGFQNLFDGQSSSAPTSAAISPKLKILSATLSSSSFFANRSQVSIKCCGWLCFDVCDCE